MKKIIFAALLIVTAGRSGFGQSSDPAIAFEHVRLPEETLNTGSNGNNDLTPLKMVNAKMIRDFSKACKSASECRWYAYGEKGTIVYYQLGDKKGRRFYDKKGNFVYNILAYTESELPSEVRDLVKRTYYLDYTIDRIEEVETDSNTYFVIHVSDDKTIKIVSVFDGEINVLLNMNKSK